MVTNLGLVGTGDWATDQMPENWREGILFEYPNGDAPLTAMTAKMKSKKVDSPILHWWTQALATQRASFTAGEMYINVTLETAYVRATHGLTVGIAGGILYVKMAAAQVAQFREGHMVLIRDADVSTVDKRAKVVDRVVAGASSYLAVKLLEADATSGTGLATADTVLIIGTINPQGSERPEGVQDLPTQIDSYTQIFRNAVDLTRTAMRTRLRTGDPLKEARRQALEKHSIEMEKAFIWGIPTTGTGTNGKPEYTTAGLDYVLRTYASDNVDDFSLNATYSGDTWLQNGETWLNIYLEQIFRRGRDSKLAFCGSGALLGLNQLALQGANIQLTPQSAQYGISVTQWVTPFGIINLKRHPLFSYEATDRNTMLIFEPERLTYDFIDDTTFHEDSTWNKGGGSGLDAIQEDYLTECAMEWDLPSSGGILRGVGLASAV